jgi:lipopolysaccharide export LptBFGC system permease protein LptF
MCLIIYYGLFFSLVSLANKNKIPVQLAVFFPGLILAANGIRFYRKLDWQS